MKIVYWDCRDGVSAEGLAGCLLALQEDAEEGLSRLNRLRVPGVTFARREDGALVVSLSPEAPMSEGAPSTGEALFQRVARQTERKTPFSREENALAVACSCLKEWLGAEKILSSAVNLADCPEAVSELPGKPVLLRAGGHTTAAGAAILLAISDEFGDMPVLTAERFADCGGMRAILGDCSKSQEDIVELNASIDDMTPEALGFALERFFAAGAVEAYTAPLTMKKSRPGVLLTVMCPETRKQDMLREIFRHTTTIGVRACYSERFALERATEWVRTPLGDMRKKVSHGYGVVRGKWEFEDAARLARETGLSLSEVCARAERGEDA